MPVPLDAIPVAVEEMKNGIAIGAKGVNDKIPETI